MMTRHDRTVRAAHKAGGNAARRHARGERVEAPDPLAGSLLARKAATAWHAGFAEARGAASGAESKAMSGYDDLGDRSGMISLDLPDGTVDPVPGGLGDGSHHVTICYLGADVDDSAFDEACQRAQDAASAVPGPMTVSLSGIGSFPPSGDSGKRPVFIPASIPGGARLRGNLEDLSASEHPFTPHVTLGYNDPDSPLPDPQPPKTVTVTHLSVHRGDDVRRFPFGGQSQTKEMDMSVLAGMERKVGPKGWSHGWVYHGIPGTGDTVHHPSHGKGIVTAVTDKHVSVRFAGSGAERTFEHSAPKPGKASGFVKRGDHEAADAGHAASKAGPHAAHATEARKLAADVRTAGPKVRVVGGERTHIDYRQGAATHLDAAADHFDAGREREGVSSLLSAKRVLGGDAYEAQRGARGAVDDLATAERHGTVRDLHHAKVRNTAADRDKSTALYERAEKLHASAKGGELSPGYLRGEGATDSDVAELARRYTVMHGKAPTSAEVAKIKRAKPGGKTATVMSRDEGLAKARSIHEADKAAGGGHLPPLALLGNEKHPNGLVTARAVDHEGREYEIAHDKNAATVTVNHKGKSLTEPAGANPTQKARELAGKLTAPAEAKPDLPERPRGAKPASAGDIERAGVLEKLAGLAERQHQGHGKAATAAQTTASHMRVAAGHLRAGNRTGAVASLLTAEKTAKTHNENPANVNDKLTFRDSHDPVDDVIGMHIDKLDPDGSLSKTRAKPAADDFWAHEQPKAPPAPPAPKPKFDQGAMFSEPDKLGTAPMFGDKFGTSGVANPNLEAVAPPSTHAAAARGLAENVRLENGLSKFQREEAETRLNSAARHLDAGNHGEALAELDAAGHATEMRGGGVIKGSTAAKARDLAAQVRADAAAGPAKSAGGAPETKLPLKEKKRVTELWTSSYRYDGVSAHGFRGDDAKEKKRGEDFAGELHRLLSTNEQPKECGPGCQDAHKFLSMVDQGVTVQDKELQRGISLPAADAKRLFRAGGSVDMPAASWTSDPYISSSYAGEKPETGKTRIIFHAAPGSKGLDLGPLIDHPITAAEAETVSGGRYSVDSVKTTGGVMHVYVTQKDFHAH